MKSSQSNFDLRSPSSYLARSYLVATVCTNKFSNVEAKKLNQFSELCKIPSRILHEISPELPLERFL